MPRKPAQPAAGAAAPAKPPTAAARRAALALEPRGAARISILKTRAAPPAPAGAGAFSTLTPPQRRAAEAWLWKFCQRWGGNLPAWRRAILVGVAKRLALHPPPPRWGTRMHRARGGHQLARQCRLAGIPHPHLVAMQAGSAWKRAGQAGLAE